MQADLYSFWQSFISLIYPNPCITCHKALDEYEQFVCTSCRLSLPRAHILHERERIKQRFIGGTPIHDAFTYLQYQKSGTTQKLLKALKYGGESQLSYHIGKWFGEELLERQIIINVDLIVPIPLHPKKLKIRGYNQADGFAKALAETFNTTWQPNFLVRTVHTRTQTQLSRKERRQNVADIFVVKDPTQAPNQHILLVDDVLTTGATLEAAAQAITAAGCQSISIAAIAHAS